MQPSDKPQRGYRFVEKKDPTKFQNPKDCPYRAIMKFINDSSTKLLPRWGS